VAPWSTGKLPEHAASDISRIKRADESIAQPDNAYPLGKFCEDGFGDCRASNLLLAFGLQAAGFCKVFVSNIYCCSVRNLEELEDIDKLQSSIGEVVENISELSREIETLLEKNEDVTPLIEEKENAEKSKHDLQTQIRQLVDEHTVVVMKDPSSENHIFLDAFDGELNGIPVLEAAKPLTFDERQKIKVMNIKNRTFYTEKEFVDGHPQLEMPIVQVRAFLTYPIVLGATLAKQGRQ
jgi:FtsZ-binding cell division protein ZapB